MRPQDEEESRLVQLGSGTFLTISSLQQTPLPSVQTIRSEINSFLKEQQGENKQVVFLTDADVQFKGPTKAEKVLREVADMYVSSFVSLLSSIFVPTVDCGHSIRFNVARYNGTQDLINAIYSIDAAGVLNTPRQGAEGDDEGSLSQSRSFCSILHAYCKW
jgi:hypothetical protein